jgi:hypothetical protein
VRHLQGWDTGPPDARSLQAQRERAIAAGARD